MRKEIDASRFSGPEQIFSQYAMILLLNQNRFFDADLVDVDASIDRGAQKRSKFVSVSTLLSSSDTTPRQILTARAHALSSRYSFPLPLLSLPSSSPLSSLFFSFSFSFLPRLLRSARTRFNARQSRANLLLR